MISSSALVAVLWAFVTGGVWATMVTDQGWRAGPHSQVRAAVESAFLTGVVVFLPVGFVVAADFVTPFTTANGNRVGSWASDGLALTLACVGVSLAVVARRRGVADDGTPTSRRAQERIWLLLGAGMATAVLVTGFY